MIKNPFDYTQDYWDDGSDGYTVRSIAYPTVLAGLIGPSDGVDMLEIGVFRGSLLKGFLKTGALPLKSYSGVDPYLGKKTDSYTGLYWKDDGESDEVYQKTRELFDQNHFSLHRTFSHEFYSQTGDQTWDVIIVDGDHRFEPALWDLHHWFTKVRPGGILIADDYGNSDTPDVTRAVTKFIDGNKRNIERMGYKILPFRNANKYLPISLTMVYFCAGSA